MRSALSVWVWTLNSEERKWVETYLAQLSHVLMYHCLPPATSINFSHTLPTLSTVSRGVSVTIFSMSNWSDWDDQHGRQDSASEVHGVKVGEMSRRKVWNVKGGICAVYKCVSVSCKLSSIVLCSYVWWWLIIWRDKRTLPLTLQSVPATQWMCVRCS